MTVFVHIGIDASRSVRAERTGTENYSYEIITALASVDKKNRYTLYYNTSPERSFPENQNFHTRIISSQRLWTQGRLAFECLVHPPDILFVPAHTIPLLRRPSMKTIVTIHDLGAQYLAQYHQFPQRLYLNRSTEYAAHCANHCIAVSEATKRDLQREFSIQDERVTVIHEGVNQKRFKPIVDKEKLNEIRGKYNLKNNFILFVGTIQPRKNLVALIRAFSSVARETPNLDLVLVGKRGWLYEDIFQEPRKLNIDDRVIFLPYVPDDDLPLLYSSASLFVLPSLYEGFGLPLLEAMACGCPVAASNNSSLPEIVGDAGLLFNPTSVEEMSSSIKRVLNDEVLRKEKIRLSFERIKSFTWEKAARETIHVFEKVAHEG